VVAYRAYDNTVSDDSGDEFLEYIKNFDTIIEKKGDMPNC
jgi:hypothetical protein